MRPLDLLIIAGIIGALLYAIGWAPTAGMVALYKRIRLAGLLWIAFVTLLAVTRIFDLGG